MVAYYPQSTTKLLISLRMRKMVLASLKVESGVKLHPLSNFLSQFKVHGYEREKRGVSFV